MADAPNSISLAPFDRKDWIVRKEKFNRYKIVNHKKYHKRRKGMPRDGTAIFVYDKGDRLTLAVCNYKPVLTTPITFQSGYTNYNIKVKDGHLVVWNVEQAVNDAGVPYRKIRNKSCTLEPVKKKVLNFGNKNVYSKKFPSQEECDAHERRRLQRYENAKEDVIIDWETIDACSSRDPFYPEVVKCETKKIKSVNERLNKILFHFLKRNKIKIPRTKDFFKNLRVACYPHTAGFVLANENLNSNYSRHFAHGDIKYVIKKTFGHDSAKLVKIICERIQKDKNLDCLLVGCLLKRLMPLDYFQQILPTFRVNHLQMMIGRNPERSLRTARKILKRYNASRVLKLVQAEDFVGHFFSDAVQMFAHAPAGMVLPEKPKNWREIHDRLMPIRQQILRAQNEAQQAEYKKANSFELPVRKHMEVVDNAVVEDLRLEVPKHTDALAEYSAKLNHCIWSYGHQVKQGTDVLAVYRGSDLLYNVSMNNKKISQFYGKRNSEPEPLDKKKVVDFLMDKKVIEASIWSQPQRPILNIAGANPAPAPVDDNCELI